MSQQYPPPNQPPYGQQQPWGPPPPPKKSVAKKVFGGCLGVTALFIVIGIGMAASSSDSDKPDTKTVAEQPAADSKGDAPAKTDDKPTVPEYGDGDYAVGKDIPPGTYESTGAKKGIFEFCGITTKPDSSDTMPQAKTANKGERIIITLEKADGVVTIAGCEPLTARK